jgi:uncharacterized membrane protein
VLPVGVIAGNAANVAGFIAAAIAVCGFLMQAPVALTGKKEQEVRAATVIGGLCGLFIACGVVLLEL